MSPLDHLAEVKTILKELNYPHRVEKVDDNEFLTIGTQTRHFLLQIRLAVRTKEDELYAVAHVPFKIPAEMMPTAFIVINEINTKIAMGCFFISMDLQSVFFRVSFPFKDKPDAELINQIVSLVVSTIDNKMSKFCTKFLLDETFTVENLLKAKPADSEVGPADKKSVQPYFRPKGVTLH